MFSGKISKALPIIISLWYIITLSIIIVTILIYSFLGIEFSTPKLNLLFFISISFSYLLVNILMTKIKSKWFYSKWFYWCKTIFSILLIILFLLRAAYVFGPDKVEMLIEEILFQSRILDSQGITFVTCILILTNINMITMLLSKFRNFFISIIPSRTVCYIVFPTILTFIVLFILFFIAIVISDIGIKEDLRPIILAEKVSPDKKSIATYYFHQGSGIFPDYMWLEVRNSSIPIKRRVCGYIKDFHEDFYGDFPVNSLITWRGNKCIIYWEPFDRDPHTEYGFFDVPWYLQL